MDANAVELLEKMRAGVCPGREELTVLVDGAGRDERELAAALAREVTAANFGDAIFIRGLIEIGNYCANDCRYCGIRRGNRRAERYRLDPDAILGCCREGYGLGFRTFVLQGGEDAFFTDDRLVGVIASVKAAFPDCALTLSLGERSRDSYRRLFDAGADRYLLRHETADPAHYALLHPEGMSYARRMRCLRDLREIGFQTGAGFMVGTPYQTAAHLAGDLLFVREFGAAMVGLGPFLPHAETVFAGAEPGDLELSLFMISLVRLLLPFALLPATTALATADPRGRERGILSGANVVMPNLSPSDVRSKYMLYDGKLATAAEAAENLRELERRMEAIGRRIVVARGDYTGRPVTG